MIEVIYKDEKQAEKGKEGTITIPKNIRQIGLSNRSNRIYVEDYVYTFLKKTVEEDPDKKLAVLTGDIKWSDGISYVFIRGAVLSEEQELSAEYTENIEKSWKKIVEESAYYFSEQQIVGWFWAQSETVMELTEGIKRTHLKLFGGSEKLLLLMNASENEEAFFRYDNGFLVRQNGYYLYYEKNPLMQIYMTERRPEHQEKNKEDIPDEAVKQFRKIIKNKKEIKETEEKTSVFSYAATACLVLALIMTGSKFYRNYQELKLVEQEVESAALLLEEENANVKKIRSDSVDSDLDEKKLMPTVLPEVTAAASEGESEVVSNEMDSENKEDIYKEESDVRKAERRIAQEEKRKEESEPVSYVIRPGDTLYQISMMKYGTLDLVPEICKLNGLTDEEIIYPGQVILLP